MQASRVVFQAFRKPSGLGEKNASGRITWPKSGLVLSGTVEGHSDYSATPEVFSASNTSTAYFILPTVRTRSLNPKLADTFCALIMPPENFDFARRLNYRCGELKSFTADEEPRLLSFVQFLTRKSRRSSPRVQIVNSQVAF